MAEFQAVIRERQRMCSSYNTCRQCYINDLLTDTCAAWIMKNPEATERIVMQWAAEHPVKTNRDKFKEVFGYNSFAECPVGWSDMEYKEEQNGN